MEHLASGDGLVGDELVPEQAGIHRVTPRTPARTAAIIDGERVHSNIHVGELHWGTNPRDDEDWPDRSLTVEVDYYPTGGTLALDNREWERGVEPNFALYGFAVDVVRDERIPRRESIEGGGGITQTEMQNIADRHRSAAADEYLLVIPDYVGPDDDDVVGANVPGTTRQFIAMDLFRVAASDVKPGQVAQMPYSNATTAFGVVLELQETGHAYDLGEADDAGGEVYSGSDEDPTLERLPGGERAWSVMTQPWTDQLLAAPMDGRYFAFNVEELSTAKTNDS